MVFTIPSVLHKLFYLNQRLCYDSMFKAAWMSLQKVSGNPKFLGAETGSVAVLHTWGQALTYHPHIHMIVPAGGLSEDGLTWIKASKKFFVPVKILSKVFRGVLWTLLQKQAGQLKVPDDYPSREQLKSKLYAKNWHVYTHQSMAGPQSVVQYLGRYTHRVAISNSRLVSAKDGLVKFRWKDYRRRLSNRLLTLKAEEFIGRFMRHILPCGFYKIRYYGLLASTHTKKKELCMALINKPQPIALLQGLSGDELLFRITGIAPDLCPKCKKGKMIAPTVMDPV
jgi:hypothetical protein